MRSVSSDYNGDRCQSLDEGYVETPRLRFVFGRPLDPVWSICPRLFGPFRLCTGCGDLLAVVN
ncbi:hypothetical protein D3C87_2166050 [compost metagenome]